MTDIFGIRTGEKGAAHRVCRVSYTLNNRQPVACTIIGDQPLFYMDYECDFEDETMLDAGDMKILESEITALKNEIKSLDRLSQEFVHAPEKIFEELLDNKETFCGTVRKSGASIDEIISIAKQSRLAEAYIEFAGQHHIEISLSSQIAEASYDRKSGTILINENLETVDQVLLAVRELRRHWQHRQGALIHPLMFHPDSAILINRMQVADLMTSVIRVAWELQLSSYKEAWERIENSSMADLGRAFAREAFLDFRTINNGQASAAVLESWFLSERCRQEDKKLIQHMLADYQGYVFDLAEAEASITPALIAALGEMPFGKNYLSAHVQTIMADPIFTDVRDRSNANFLWFIKFERTFRETEQELQLTSDQTADDIRQAAILKQNQGLNNGATQEAEFAGNGSGFESAGQAYAQQQTAEIVQLFPHGKEVGDEQRTDGKLLSAPKVGKAKQSAQSAEIIYLRRWSGE